ncbi:MAG: hypothetical protein E7177_01800 [Erysipelotrichaceae bacterium]|nr:hypothetical protein [Erysipelotrichaceae bacterium]
MKKNLLVTLLMAATLVGAIGCGNPGSSSEPGPDDKYAGLEGTALAVAKASDMTLEELKAASKAEMEASNDTFKVVGLTSTLAKALTQFCEAYDWVVSEAEAEANPELKVNTFVNNGYKDYALLTALESADESYFADFALVQDARGLADYLESGITHNYVPSDYASLGLAEEDTYPLKGIHFNKIFYHHKDYTGPELKNIWQLAGSAEDEGHISKFSFQSPVTEQINMSFLLCLQAEENAPRILEAYKKYYGKDWQASDDYATVGEQLVKEMVDNVTTWHKSDGDSMKKTIVNAKDTVFYGAFAKMKDAAGYPYDSDGDNVDDTTVMSLVDWNLEIEGFNGFMYTMYSQIVNNAKHPYTACLYARHLLLPECYEAMCYNKSTPNKAGEKSNMYGYYYPCASTTVGVNDNDLTKDQWMEKSIIEDYAYLAKVKTGQVNTILTWVNSSKAEVMK